MSESTQKISLLGAILMNVNLMVGSAAFIGPAIMAGYASRASFYGWLLAALIFAPVVWCISQISLLFPGKGSFYSYSKHGISSTAGFISGWVYFLGYISIGATQLVSLNEILMKEFALEAFQSFTIIFNALLLVILLCISFLPLSTIDRIQSSATLFKVTPLLIGICSLFFYFKPHSFPAFTDVSPSLLVPTIPIAIFGFWGFEGVCSISHLIEGSKENASKAVLFGFAAAVTVYTLFHISLLSLMSPETLQAQTATRFITHFGLSSPLITALLQGVVSGAIIIAHVNAIFGGLLANSSMFTTMAEEKLLFLSSFFAKRTQTGRPFGAAIAHITGILLFVSLLCKKEILNAMSNLGVLGAFFLTIVSLLIIQYREKLYGKMIIGVLALFSCGLLSYHSWDIIGNTTLQRFFAASPFIIIILMGYIMFLHAQRTLRKNMCP